MTHRHVTVTEHFGDGICVYEAKYNSPEEYVGDDLKKIGGPFPSWKEAEVFANAVAGQDEVYEL